MKIDAHKMMVNRLFKLLWVDKLIFMKIGKNPRALGSSHRHLRSKDTQNGHINKR